MFFLTTEQEMLKKIAVELVENEIKSVANKMEREKEFPRHLFKTLGEAGILGLTIPYEYDGNMVDSISYITILEEISRGWIAVAGAISVHSMVAELINNFGTEKQKKKYLPSLASGDMIGAIAITEPEAGSDIQAISCNARSQDAGYCLNGNKIFVTSGGEAELYIILCRTENSFTTFLVEKEDPGFEFGKLEEKMGYDSSPTRELIMNECFVPDNRMLGSAGMGLDVIFKGLNAGRVGVGCMATGVSRAALEHACAHMKNRKQFGKSLGQFQGLQFMVSDMAARLEAARSLLYTTALKKDSGESFTREASMAKLFASDTAMHITTQAVQLLGGYGYTRDYPVERFMREAKMLQIVEGTNEIQKMIIWREIFYF